MGKLCVFAALLTLCISGVASDGCHDDSVLAQCKAWGQYSKQDNGCQAYASGWSRKGNSCHGCTATDYAYTACDLNQCHALCDDLYGALYNGRRRRNGHESHRRQCKTGCDKYRELAHNAGLILYDDETPQAIAAVESEVAALTTEMAELKAGHEMSTTSDSSSETTTASEVAAESTQSAVCPNNGVLNFPASNWQFGSHKKPKCTTGTVCATGSTDVTSGRCCLASQLIEYIEGSAEGTRADGKNLGQKKSCWKIWVPTIAAGGHSLNWNRDYQDPNQDSDAPKGYKRRWAKEAHNGGHSWIYEPVCNHQNGAVVEQDGADAGYITNGWGAGQNDGIDPLERHRVLRLNTSVSDRCSFTELRNKIYKTSNQWGYYPETGYLERDYRTPCIQAAVTRGHIGSYTKIIDNDGFIKTGGSCGCCADSSSLQTKCGFITKACSNPPHPSGCEPTGKIWVKWNHPSFGTVADRFKKIIQQNPSGVSGTILSVEMQGTVPLVGGDVVMMLNNGTNFTFPNPAPSSRVEYDFYPEELPESQKEASFYDLGHYQLATGYAQYQAGSSLAGIAQGRYPCSRWKIRGMSCSKYLETANPPIKDPRQDRNLGSDDGEICCPCDDSGSYLDPMTVERTIERALSYCLAPQWDPAYMSQLEGVLRAKILKCLKKNCHPSGTCANMPDKSGTDCAASDSNKWNLDGSNCNREKDKCNCMNENGEEEQLQATLLQENRTRNMQDDLLSLLASESTGKVQAKADTTVGWDCG